ncbi:biotin biosynthesis protein BioY [Thalassospira profundimaris]|uniref:Biotin transporter n=1 Tax=Thalassospira profundimaris TaxID=502049 RepID=A0A367XKW4_9PROT|nr:biotin transporter BioY [Thalassospira profundimaris]RCK54293.1 biotin biosynthesis protein BioY [Thalassospira profundimaris]
MKTRDIVYIALFAALMAVLGLFPPFTLPVTGVPITAQSLAPMLAGAILGARRGALSVVLFLVLVALGLPLLAGGRGGFGVFLGPTGGFMLGWTVSAFVIGYLIEKFWDRLNVVNTAAIIGFGGIVVLYALGNAWVAVAVDISYWKATVGSAPFLIGDALKVFVATGAALVVRRAYPLVSSA